MKKQAWLWLIVLTAATTAWASPIANVVVLNDQPIGCDDYVKVKIVADVPGTPTCVDVRKTVICGSTQIDIYVDIACGPPSCIRERVCLGKYNTGLKIVTVRVFCRHAGCDVKGCCPSQIFCMPQLCAMGSTSFTVCDPCCLPCWWPWMCLQPF